MKERIGILVPLMCIFIMNAHGQLTQNETQGSAAAVAGKSGLGNSLNSIYTPDLYTGTANISIPIYNYAIDGLNFDVSLSYNTGGIKVNDVASDVGLGWVLNAGAGIMREVKGIEDEITFKELDTLVSGGGNLMAIQESRGSWVTLRTNTPGVDLDVAHLDKEPDIFHVSLGNESFSFSLKWPETTIFNSFFTVLKDTKNDMQVDVYLSDYNIYSKPSAYTTEWNRFPKDIGNNTVGDVYILRFKITDRHGNQFFFDRGDCEQRDYASTTSFFSGPTFLNNQHYSIPNNWVISKVITYTGTEIKYTYLTKSYSYPGHKEQKVEETKDFNDCYGDFYGIHGVKIIDREIATILVKQQLQKIELPNSDVVTFIYDDNARIDLTITHLKGGALKEIEIGKAYDAYVGNKFTYKFNYSYFNSENGTSSQQVVPYPNPGYAVSNPLYNLRLRLDNIYKIGIDNTTSELYYKFGYNDAVSLPPRVYGFTDCYGYYNGTTAGVAVSCPIQLADMDISQHVSSYYIDAHDPFTYGRNKQPNWVYAKYDILNEIQNGMGGKLTFEYQDHALSNPADFNSSPMNTGYYLTNGSSYSGNMYDFTGWHNYQPPTDLEYPNANDGVCIKAVTMHDGYNADNNTTTTFDFEGGMRFIVGGYSWYPIMTTHASLGGADGADGDIGPLKRVYTNSFVGPRADVRGFNHGYSKVTEKVLGFAGEIINHKEYSFTNISPTSGENVNGAAATGSRIKLPYGIFAHTLPPVHFRKKYLGLLKSVNEYIPGTTSLLSSEITTFDEQLNPSDDDLLGAVKFTANTTCSAVTLAIGNSNYFESAGVFPVSQLSRSYSGSTYTDILKEFSYDNDLNLKDTKWDDSKGNHILERNYYSTGMYYREHWRKEATTSGWVFDPLHKDKYLKYLVGKRRFINSNIVGYSGIGINITASLSHYYDPLGNDISSPAYHHGILVTGPMGAFHFDKVTKLKTTEPVVPVGPYDMDNMPLPVIQTKHFTKYDDHNYVIEAGYNDDQNFSSFIWDTRIGQKIAEISNARYDEIAYTSFEGPYKPVGVADYNKGNWNFNPNDIAVGTADDCMTGKYYLSYNAGSNQVKSFVTPSAGKLYVVSFWYSGTRPSALLGTYSISLTDQMTVNGWTLATGSFTGNGTNIVEFQPTGIGNLDELRLHPADAQMNTWTYEPLIGASSKCNERNVITYFEYDVMGRLRITRDIDRNIIRLQKSVVQGADN